MNELAPYYKVLGLETTATSADIKEAYRSLAKKWHPDRFTLQPQLLIKAQQEIQKINQAYEILKNQHKIERNSSDLGKTHVVKTKQSAAEIHYQRGVEFAEKKQDEKAIAEFTQAIKLDSEYLNAYQYRGFLLSNMGCELRANADFRQVTTLKIKQKYQTPEKANNNKSYETKGQTTTKSWQCDRTLIAHTKLVSDLILSQDNSFFISSSHDGKIKLWQTHTGQVITTLRSNVTPINSIALSQNQKILIAGNQDKTIRFWNLAEKKAFKTLNNRFSEHSQAVIAIALDSQTNILISAGADDRVKIWDLDRAQKIRDIDCKSGNLTCLAINEAKGYFCSGGLERQLRIRDLKAGSVIRSLRGDSGVLTLAFSPNGKFLAAGQLNCQIQIWNIETGQKYCLLKGHQDRISALTFSSDNQTLISGSWDNNIKLWNLKTANQIDTLQGHTNIISSLAITKNNCTIISGSRDCTIKIWRNN